MITGITVRRRPAKGRLRGRSGHCLRVRLAHQHRSARRTRMRRRGSWPATACSPRLPQNLKLVSFAVNSQATVSIRACRTRHAPPTPPLAALTGMPFTILSAIYRTSGSQDPPAGDRPAEDSRSGTGRRRGPGADDPREPARRDVVATARIRGRRPGQIGRGRGFLDHQQPDISSAAPLRWRNHIFCAAGA